MTLDLVLRRAWIAGAGADAPTMDAESTSRPASACEGGS